NIDQPAKRGAFGQVVPVGRCLLPPRADRPAALPVRRALLEGGRRLRRRPRRRQLVQAGRALGTVVPEDEPVLPPGAAPATRVPVRREVHPRPGRVRRTRGRPLMVVVHPHAEPLAAVYEALAYRAYPGDALWFDGDEAVSEGADLSKRVTP